MPFTLPSWSERKLIFFAGHVPKPYIRDTRYMIWRHMNTIHEEPALCNLMFQHIRPSRDYSQTAVFQLNREYTRQTLEIIRSGIEAGELRNDVPLRLVRDMICCSMS